MSTKILVVSPIKADATSYYRAWGPLQSLENVELIDLSVDLEISWAVMTRGDILFMQRPSTENEIRIMEIARYCNVPIWIDYDDDYFNIPKHNPRYELYGNPHRKEQLKRAIEMANVVTVSTIGLRNALIESGSGHADKIVTVSNAVDDALFDLTTPSPKVIGDRDVILWRGGDTHDEDMAPYIDKMVDLYNEFPRFKWAFMGNAPEEFISRIDSDRVQLYEWEDVFVYFHRLLELKPRVTIVPWAENKFNLSKSNCSWLESTLAGAAVVFPNWSKEWAHGMSGYETPETFYECIKEHLTTDFSQTCVRLSFEIIAKNYALSSIPIRSTRTGIVSGLSALKKSRKLSFREIPYWQHPQVEPATDKEFFDYCHEKLHLQDNENYKQGHYKTAQFLLDQFKPKSIIEIGCGPGAMLEYFLDKRILQVKGFDLNPYFKEYFEKRNPHYADHFIVSNISDGELEGVFDLCISCEVFEHIPADQANALIDKLSYHFKNFYFTSTPYHTSKKFDAWWGHCNLNTHENWIKIFEARGWKYEGNPHLLVGWDHIFSSTRTGSPVLATEDPTLQQTS